ncbi:hypothetical protein Tco_1329809 [Tanacetum coccineum]
MSNNHLQTNTKSALYNVIIEAGNKDPPPMLAPATRKSRVKETYATISEETRKKLDAEAKRVHIILTGIDNDIYSTVDACPNAEEIWKAIERVKQGENINKQDVETNLYREFRKFTSKDGESLESYYSRLYKMMNELVRNQCIIDNHHMNPKPTCYTQTSTNNSPATTKSKGKEITKTPSPPESDHEVVSDEEETLRDKEIQKLMALISTSFKKINKPTNNNLRTSSNTRNMNVDRTPRSDRRIWFDRQTRQYENQRVVNVARNRENVGTLIVQQNEIQCLSCKEFRHVAKECKKMQKGKRILLIIRKRF